MKLGQSTEEPLSVISRAYDDIYNVVNIISLVSTIIVNPSY